MGLLIWLENTQLGEYMRVSAYGYAVMLSLHAIGLAVMVGLSVVLSPRAATLNSPTRGRVKIPHLTAAGRGLFTRSERALQVEPRLL